MMNLKKYIIMLVFVFIIIMAVCPKMNYGATEQNGYWIQAGVFKNETNAETLILRLKKAGFSPVEEKDGFFYVYIGPYENKVDADKIVKKVKSYGFDAFVKKKPVEVYNSNDMAMRVSPTIAQSNLNKTESKNYFLEADVKLTGIIGSHTIFIPIDKHWSLGENAYL